MFQLAGIFFRGDLLAQLFYDWLGIAFRHYDSPAFSRQMKTI
jgi:hypothetical protein